MTLRRSASLAAVLVALELLSASPTFAGPQNSETSNVEARGVTAQSAYVLGPEDQIIIRALEAEEISDKPFRIDASGYIPLPMVGRIRAAGLTVEELEKSVSRELQTYLKTPQVSISVVEFRSQPVSIIGAVSNPGVHQLQGRKTLLEMLSLAGGLKPDAGPLVKITRPLESGSIPAPNGALDSTGRFYVTEVVLKDLIDATNPHENLLIQPHDVISVPKARMIYVVGDVGRPGGFVTDGQEAITVLKALSLAQGLGKDAAPQNARIIQRGKEGTSTADNGIPVRLDKILQGKSPDQTLQPENILFVPSSAPKKAATRAVEAAIQLGTGIVIFRR